MSDGTLGPCFFHESATSIAVSLDVLENFVFPQIVAEVEALVSKEMVQQPITVPLYALLWTDDSLVDESTGKGRLIGPTDS
jgi:hypothetical protein